MVDYALRCIQCGVKWDPEPSLLVCPDCGAQEQKQGPIRGVLRVELEDLPEKWPRFPLDSPEFLHAFLPLDSPQSLFDFPVGGTPLLPVRALRRRLNCPNLWIKDDTRNPSGSTKDRASLLVVAKALEFGFETVATASTGNAATALAACGAAAGLEIVVFVPASAPPAKLLQILSYGGRLLPIDGTYDQAFDLSIEACQTFGWYNRNTALNPYTVEGKKTVALEIVAQMGRERPDVAIVPTGDGVILSGVEKGFSDLVKAGLLDRVPRLMAVQPEGSCAIARAWRTSGMVEPHLGAHSIADSLTVEMPRNAIWCLEAIRRTQGNAVIVTDDQIASAVVEMGGYTGIFAEPAGAASLAGLRVALEQGLVAHDERIVLLVTGNGLKDPTAASQLINLPDPVAPHLESIEQHIISQRKYAKRTGS